MSKTHRLRLREVRQVQTLLEDVRGFGLDPEAWQTCALNGLCRLTGAAAGTTINVSIVADAGGEHPEVGSVVQVGAGHRAAGSVLNFARDVRGDPLVEPLRRLLRQRPFVTARREELVGDGDWYAA